MPNLTCGTYESCFEAPEGASDQKRVPSTPLSSTTASIEPTVSQS
jgi:hypothetical protein